MPDGIKKLWTTYNAEIRQMIAALKKNQLDRLSKHTYTVEQLMTMVNTVDTLERILNTLDSRLSDKTWAEYCSFGSAYKIIYELWKTIAQMIQQLRDTANQEQLDADVHIAGLASELDGIYQYASACMNVFKRAYQPELKQQIEEKLRRKI